MRTKTKLALIFFGLAGIIAADRAAHLNQNKDGWYSHVIDPSDLHHETWIIMFGFAGMVLLLVTD